MMINGSTKVCGLLGNPVAQSFSPLIQNAFAQAMNLNMIYTTFRVGEGKLKKAIDAIDGLDLMGLNVTIPYKLDVIKYLNQISKEAEIIGAVNTIERSGDSLIGHNTDWIGLKCSLEEANISLLDKTVVILGAGGAARACSVMAIDMGAKKLLLCNRTIDKAMEIKRILERNYAIPIEVLDYEALETKIEIDIAFQTTSVGMVPDINESPIYKETFFDQLEVAIDLVYNPYETLFLKLAKEAGVKTLNGMGMLFYQGVKAFEIWTKTSIPKEVQREVYELFVEEMRKK